MGLDRLRFHLGRLGRVGAAGALLAVASLAYHAAAVQPRAAAVTAQRLHNAATLRAAEAERAAASAAATAGEAGQPTLAPAAAAALRRLFDAAEAAGLDLPQGEYRLTEIQDAHLRRYQLSLPVAGSYPAIRAFMAAALGADPALALAGVQLRRERIEAHELDALLNFVLYLEADA